MAKKRDDLGDGFSREREFKVILEEIQSQFRAFGEGLGDLRTKMERMDGRMERFEGRMERFEDRMICFDGRMTRFEDRMMHIETIVAGLNAEFPGMKKDIAFIKMALETVATKDDLLRLERRITRLETSHT